MIGKSTGDDRVGNATVGYSHSDRYSYRIRTSMGIGLILIVGTSLFTSTTAFSTNPTLLSPVSRSGANLYRQTQSQQNCNNNFNGVSLCSTTRDDTEIGMSTGNHNGTKHGSKVDHLPKLVQIYVNYTRKLWRQTNRTEREKIASEQAMSAIQRVKCIMEGTCGTEYVDIGHAHEGDTTEETNNRTMARDQLLEACNNMIECMENEQEAKIRMEADTAAAKKAMSDAMDMEEANSKAMQAVDNNENAIGEAGKKKKKGRSVFFGAAMGAIVAGWVFSGNLIFTTCFTFMTILGQLEYYRMVMRTGVYPARKISVVGACAMFVTVR